MPGREPVFKSVLTGEVSGFISKKRHQQAKKNSTVDGDVDFLNILEFIDRFNLFPDGLFAAQKFIIKLYYNLPLDETEKSIKITDRNGDTVRYELTEVEYLQYLFDNGRCNIRSQDGKERRELVLILGRRAGKCIKEGSLVFTDKGVIPIEQFGDSDGPEWQEIDSVVAGEICSDRATKFYNPGVADTKSITSEAGYELTGTPEHRIKVMSKDGTIEWCRLSDLQVGDWVGINRNSDLWSSSYLDVSPFIPAKSPQTDLQFPQFLDERWGRLLGILTGDGSWTRRSSIQVTGGREEFRVAVENEFENLFGGSTTYRKKWRKSTLPLFPWTVSSYSKPGRQFLHALGWNWDATPPTKHVPWAIFRSPKSVVSAYLSGLFETDGGLEKRGSTISFSTASKRLASEVQILLINFGIVSRVSVKLNRRYNRYYYRVTVLGYESRVIFAREIGFLTSRKNDELIHGLIHGEEGHSSTESVPFQKANLRALIDSVPPSRNNVRGVSERYRTWLKEACGNCVKPNSHENPGYARLKRIIDLAKQFGALPSSIGRLQSIVDAHYFWDQVKTIHSGRDRVYDLTVPNGHAFVAQGFTNHNSALAAVFAAYELYKLLKRGHPQAYYGMPPGSEIRILDIANDKEQASIVYNDIQGHIQAIDYFKNNIAHDTQTFLRFRTENDREKFGPDGKSTITATFKSSIAKGLRGRGIICAILDEIAFFVDNGKCEHVFSKVQTSDGLVTLDDILTRSNVDRSKPGWTEISPIRVAQESGQSALATHVYYGGLQKTLRLSTKSRYTIEATPEHLLKVMSPNGDIEWKYVRDIFVGDFIGINRSAGLWPDGLYDCSHLINVSSAKSVVPLPTHIDEDLGEFLGILVGDGTWRSGKTISLIQVTGGCEQLLPFVESHFQRFLGRHRVSRKKPHKHSTCEISPWRVTRQCHSFRAFLDELGYRLDVTKSTKSVPWTIFRSPKRVTAAFLRGLFETDGGLEHSGGTISFATASRKLAEDVQLLLLNFGITASIYYKYNKKYDRHYYYLRIIGLESRRLFAQQIGFITPRKNDALVNGLYNGRAASNLIPNQHLRLRQILESVPVSVGRTKGDDARTRVTRLCSSSSDPKRRSLISYDSAHRLVSLGRELGADPVSLDALENILRTNYFWDPVTVVEQSKAEVADLRVPDGNEYVAQGMTNHNSSAERVYKAIKPSIAQFARKDKKTRRAIGDTEGRMILISSPDAREGFFYKQYQMSLSGGPESRNMLMIQAPTWEIRPDLPTSYYEAEYAKDPAGFMTEHGAEFSDRVRGFIEDPNDLQACIVKDLRPKTNGIPREVHWAGVDFGISGDGTGISLTHINQGKIELAYHEIWYPKKKWAEVNPHLSAPMVPYAMTLQDVSRIDIDAIIEWFYALSKRFYILKGVFDQWAGPVFEQILHKKGLTQFEMRNFTPSESSSMWRTFKMSMYYKQLALYDFPIPVVGEGQSWDGNRHSPLIAELLELQQTFAGKNVIVVASPDVAGKHDDQSDSLSRSIMLAHEYIKDNPSVLTIGAVQMPHQARAVNMYGYHHYHKLRNRLHGSVGIRNASRVAPRIR